MAQDLPDIGTNECASDDGLESDAATSRGELYSFLLNYLELDEESDLGCATTVAGGIGSAADVYAYWDYDDGGDDYRCTLVNYFTEWSVYNPEDYKKCVCWFYTMDD